jgi:hypothetical protein
MQDDVSRLVGIDELAVIGVVPGAWSSPLGSVIGRLRPRAVRPGRCDRPGATGRRCRHGGCAIACGESIIASWLEANRGVCWERGVRRMLAPLVAAVTGTARPDG